MYANNTVLIRPNISYISGSESGANVQFTSTTSVANNIVSGEERYWDPISIYDYETEKNEFNKSIRVLDRSYSTQVSKELETLLK
jgi:hypothetical protein